MIFAKIKGSKRQPPEHRVLFVNPESSNDFHFYLPPTISEKTKFNPEKKLDSHEWFYVELSPDQIGSMIQPYLINENSSADLNKAIESDYSVIEVVYRVIHSTIIFTKITDSFRIRNRILLKFHDLEQAKLIKEESSIEFSGKKDAYFDGNNRLYFRDFSKIRSMFPGIEEFYREATQSEKQEFLDNDLFDVEDIEPDQIGQRDSSRIAAILNDDTIGLRDGSNTTKILRAAQEFAELGIHVQSGRLIMKDKKDLHTILNLITSRYYISDITGKKMQSYGSAALDTTE